ncbi:Chain length determinant protein [Roseimaritima multifibrata]|uniref:Chain length determinant protein n=1 Tax=Roseimaritima multifibrata TaxID=1930274 RepID=A0A517ML80_9BACT|nr:exopolysaccharide biosynthesis protein [Roseimaritima multifibrata]QDS95600.1 Chain length determinant protein [Roseimaritima multifibrata]
MTTPADKWADLTPADLVRTVRSRLPSVLLTAFVVTCLVALALLAMPNRYSSEGMLFVRLGRGSVSLDPTSTTTATVSLQESRRAEVASVREMLDSRIIAERVVDAIGPDEFLKPRTRISKSIKNLLTFLPSRELSSYGEMSGEAYEKAIEREEAIAKLQSQTSVSIPDNSYNVVIRVELDDPFLARDAVEHALDIYHQDHIQAHSVSGSLDFFEQQCAESLQASLAAQRNLRDAKNRMQILSSDSQERTLQERIAKLELAYDETTAELSRVTAEKNGLIAQRDLLEEWIPTEKTSGVANQAGDGMREALYDLEIQEREALSRLNPSHPKYKAMQKQVVKSAEIVQGQKEDRPLTVESLNPIRLTLASSVMSNEGVIAGLKAKLVSIENNLETSQEALAKLNNDAVELSELTWIANIAEANHLKHSTSLEEARMLAALDQNGMSDLSVVQPASLMLKKTGPQRSMLLLIGGVLGLCLGTLQALIRTPPAPPAPSLGNPKQDNQHHDPSPPETTVSAETPLDGEENATTPDELAASPLPR